MTEPILTSADLKPLFQVVFRKRLRIFGIFILATLVGYSTLLVVKLARYESVAVVMVKIPVIDFEFRIDPNPQVAPAYVDLAQADALLFDTHAKAVEMRRLAEPLAKEYGVPETMSLNERDNLLRKLKRDSNLVPRLTELAISLSKDWEKEFFVQPEFFLGLFEIEKDSLEQVPLYMMQESFTVKTNIAQQTNITLVNQPFLNFRVRWDSPGSAAVFANLWTQLFVEHANDLAVKMGFTTEESILKESSKIDKEVAELKKQIAELQAKPEYQKLLQVQGLENALYGGRAKVDMFGYVELHADVALQAGLVGELSKLELDRAQAAGKLEALQGAGATDQGATLEVAGLEGQIKGVKTQIEVLKSQAQTIRQEISGFDAEYRQAQFEIDQRNRIMAERLTTATFSSTRLKSGYAVPPISFVERAIPSKHPTGPPRSILAVIIGFLCSMLYVCWVIYRGYLVPVAGG